MALRKSDARLRMSRFLPTFNDRLIKAEIVSSFPYCLLYIKDLDGAQRWRRSRLVAALVVIVLREEVLISRVSLEDELFSRT